MKLQISEISNKDELSGLIINELKDIGVKYRKDKKSKIIQEKQCRKRIFRTHLHLLELTDVILASGGVVEIPKFVADACNRILEQVDTEGIFRKAGSSIRQKEIRISLEAGLPLGKSHHVIDVANVVKSFFRELPEPLIPTSMQETLLRGLLIGDNNIKAILLTCLLLPPLTLNILTFFMQFLNTVAANSYVNKMTTENLAIIFTPGLMPFSDINSHRFENHVKVVQQLIESAHAIGTIPDCIIDKLQIHEIISNTPSKSRSFEALQITQKKKKKRRSEMFNGLRKIVGSAIGSSENLESTPENKTVTTHTIPSAIKNVQKEQQPPVVATPCLLKTTMKRKFTEPVCAFSAKKKKDLLALLPNNSGGLLPNTPQIKESKKSRLSLGGRRHMKNVTNSVTEPVVQSVERRWSIVGSGWSKHKYKGSNGIKTPCNSAEEIPTDVDPLPTNYISSVASVPALPTSCLPKDDDTIVVSNISSEDTASITDCSSDYVRISKNEYEAIRERVAAIEARITQEFDALSRSSMSSLRDDIDGQLSGPERVIDKYERMVEDTESLTSPATEKLAQRLSRELKIRRSCEQRVMRSPSARKIRTIRRRSQEKVRLSRNQTWHISSTSNKELDTPSKQAVPSSVSQSSFYGKSNLKRGRPNTVNTGLHTKLLSERLNYPLTPTNKFPLTPTNKLNPDDKWIDGNVFFNKNFPAPTTTLQPKYSTTNQVVDKSGSPSHILDNMSCTPMKENEMGNNFDNVKTPMLPPKSVSRKISANRIQQNSAAKSIPFDDFKALTPTDKELNGRASIARLRAQNAGMVMAKAKLFDKLGVKYGCNVEKQISSEQPATPAIRKKNSSFELEAPCDVSSALATDQAEQPRLIEDVSAIGAASPNGQRKKIIYIRSPGYVQKRHPLSLVTKYPDKQILNSIATDERLIQPRKINPVKNIQNIVNNHVIKTASPASRTPKMRSKHTAVNSPRRARTQGIINGSTRIRTPLKAHAQAFVATNSPKIGLIKQNSRKIH